VGSAMGLEDGLIVGDDFGLSEGPPEGDEVGDECGLPEGSAVVGPEVGLNVGDDLGFFVGLVEGLDVGVTVGDAAGFIVGSATGLDTGEIVGDDVGLAMGLEVGPSVGTSEGTFDGKSNGDDVMEMNVGPSTAGSNNVGSNGILVFVVGIIVGLARSERSRINSPPPFGARDGLVVGNPLGDLLGGGVFLLGTSQLAPSLNEFASLSAQTSRGMKPYILLRSTCIFSRSVRFPSSAGTGPVRSL